MYKLDKVKLNSKVYDGKWSEDVCYMVVKINKFLNVVIMLSNMLKEMLIRSYIRYLWIELWRVLW